MTKKKTASDTLDDVTFERAFAELEEIIARLEAGGLSLDEGLRLFERGQALTSHCSTQLDQAELKIKQITPKGLEPPGQ
jgi:exodeoxyribonuclease VII small subunit